MPAKSFADKLKGLTQNREQIQKQMQSEHSDLQKKIRDLQAQRQALAGARATKSEMVAVAEKSIRDQAAKFERRQREHGLGQLQARSAAALMQPPNIDGLQGPQNMQLREGVVRNHRQRLFSILFMAHANPKESDQINAETMAGLVAWCCGDMILGRVKEFADGLEDAPDGDVRDKELQRLDDEIKRLQGEAEQMRQEAAQAGLHLGAA